MHVQAAFFPTNVTRTIPTPSHLHYSPSSSGQRLPMTCAVAMTHTAVVPWHALLAQLKDVSELNILMFYSSATSFDCTSTACEQTMAVCVHHRNHTCLAQLLPIQRGDMVQVTRSREGASDDWIDENLDFVSETSFNPTTKACEQITAVCVQTSPSCMPRATFAHSTGIGAGRRVLGWCE